MIFDDGRLLLSPHSFPHPLNLSFHMFKYARKSFYVKLDLGLE